MVNNRQLIYEHEMKMESGKPETHYFYDDRPYEIKSFMEFELPKLISKGQTVVYSGKPRTETIRRFKNDGLMKYCVSSY